MVCAQRKKAEKSASKGKAEKSGNRICERVLKMKHDTANNSNKNRKGNLWLQK